MMRGGGKTTRSPKRGTRAFSLIELLVVMTIIVILMALLLPGLRSLRQGALSVRCMSNLRVLSSDFHLFANDGLHDDRGDSESMGGAKFYFQDFVEKGYRIDEFWETGSRVQSMNPSTDPMICPVSDLPLKRRGDRRCEDDAVFPAENVSYSFNRRLHEQTILVNGRPFPDRDTRLDSSVLEHPNVPIALDVDGARAARNGRKPFFTAPPVEGHDDWYSNGLYWFPSSRHRGRTNVVFVGGYVQTSADPAGERGWDWKYQPTPLH